MKIPKPIFTNLTGSLQHLVQRYCTEFNQTCTRHVERMDRNSLMPPIKAWVSLHRFLAKLITTQQHYVKIFCTRFHPDWLRNTNVQVYVNLDPSVKYDYHEAEYCQTHASQQLLVWCKKIGQFSHWFWVIDRCGIRLSSSISTAWKMPKITALWRCTYKHFTIIRFFVIWCSYLNL